MAKTGLTLWLVISIKFIGAGSWYLQVRPPIKYTTLGANPAITCYNISTTVAQLHNSRWYKVATNGTLQQLSTNTSERVRSDGSQLRISSAINKDNGTYCCKAPMQTLNACDENAKATLIVVMPPVIVAKQNQTVFVGKNVTIECTIENVGTPPFVVFRWQKLRQKLVTDGQKYISQLIENRMFLTIVNSTTDDESYYQCILETPVFQRRQASVYLSVNDTRITHAGSINVSLPSGYYSLQLHGPNEIPVGMNMTIHCIIIESDRSAENNDIQLSLVTPTGKVIMGNKFSTVATLEYNGTFSCIAIANAYDTPMMASLQLFVYAAPQPSFHNATVSASYGSDVSLPCVIDIANPPPLYNWTHIPAKDPSPEIDNILSDGSLQLKNVQKSGIYQCIVWNDYGSSLQIVKLKVEMTTRNHSLKLVGKHLQTPCDQPKHATELSTLLQEYITNICSCSDITVHVSVTSCTDQTARYIVQFNGVMATEAALLLITEMKNLTGGLDLIITILYLENQTNCNDDHNKASQTGFFSYIATLSAITLVTLLTIIVLYLIMRKVMTKEFDKYYAKPH